eukprot:13895061-Alexandrium_andersonii.AAC.1
MPASGAGPLKGIQGGRRQSRLPRRSSKMSRCVTEGGPELDSTTFLTTVNSGTSWMHSLVSVSMPPFHMRAASRIMGPGWRMAGSW